MRTARDIIALFEREREAAKIGPEWRCHLAPRMSQCLGRCSYGAQTVDLNRRWALAAPEADLVDTIRHELAHVLTPGQGHNWAWKQAAHNLGARPERFASPEKAMHGFHGWVLYCHGCRKVLGMRTRRAKSGRPIVSKCCRKPVEWLRKEGE